MSKEQILGVIGAIFVPIVLGLLMFGLMAGTGFQLNAGAAIIFFAAVVCAVSFGFWSKRQWNAAEKDSGSLALRTVAESVRRRNLRNTLGRYLRIYEQIEREFLKDPDSTMNDRIQTAYFLEVDKLLLDAYGEGEASKFKGKDSGTIESAIPPHFSPANRKMLRQIRGRKEMLESLIDELKERA